MIKSLATCIVIFTTLLTYGQSPTKAEIDATYEQGFALRNGPLDSAFQLIQKSGQLSQSIQYESGLLKAEIFSMFYFARKGRLDTARVIEERVISSLQSSSLKNTLQEGLAYYYAGIVKLRGQQLSEAKKYYFQALEVFEKLEDEYYIGSTYSRLGIIEMDLSNYSEALELFIKSYELKVAANRPPGEYAPELANISTVYWRMGFVEDAFDYAHRSLRLEQERGNHINIARSLMNIGSLHAPSNSDSAIYYYDASYQVASANGFIKVAGLAKYNRALQLRNLGKLDTVIEEMRDLLEEVRVHEYVGMNANIFALLAESYLLKNQVSQAIPYAQRSLKLSLTSGSKRNTYRSANILAAAYEKLKNKDSVLYYTRMHYAYRDSVFSRENQAKITEMNTRLDNLEIQKELEVLEKQKEVDEASKLLLVTSLVALGVIFTLIVILLILRQKSIKRKQQLKDLQMKKELKDQEQELQQQTLHMINMNHGISEVEKQLVEIKEKDSISGRDVQRVLSNIKINKSIEKEWQNFDTYFGKMHRDFYENLDKKHPSLSVQNKRLAALVKVELNNKEIGQILNISHSSVKMARYRLKVKMGLSEDDKLTDYLKQI